MTLIKRPPLDKAPLHILYRPQSLDEVIGQDAVVTNLKRLFEVGRIPHAFLFTGPSGCGKTTLARIIATMLECSPEGIIEVDAARYSGIESMRGLLSGAQYTNLGASEKKLYIIDECHALSKATWQTLLLSIEEPQDHLYWVLCTTEAARVPKTIQTRCHSYDLKPVRWDLLAEYIEAISEEEKLQVKKEFIELASRRAQGSVRQALVYLSMLDGIIERKDALRILDELDAESEGPVMLARMIVTGKGFTWTEANKLLQELQDESPEGIRRTILGYASTVLMNTKEIKNAERVLAVMQTFSQPCDPGAGMIPIILGVGSLLLGE